MTDYSLWEVILNGNKVLKRQVRETEQEYEPTTAEEKLCLLSAIGFLLRGLEVDWIRRIHVLDTAYWGFLGVGITHGYAVSSLMDTAYWSSEQ
ncbi:hypothetical protein Tco_0799578 [Tanacetum coccineum]|uniref:Uncharacterized protein n=1 Tax=Tanacetum coccineum TaxID=301880 RepID=A0ABQ4ZQP8_9ASTR